MVRTMKHDIKKLPKWAQQLIESKESELAVLKRQKEQTEAAHTIIKEHEWYPLHGPSVLEKQDHYTLFVLFENAAHAVCCLSKGDVLLIGKCKD